jgi:hypothetical protein
MEYKNGDRVIITHYTGNTNIKAGDRGTVCNAPMGICYDKFIGGHDCNGRCKGGYGWYTSTSCFEKLKQCQLEFNF